MMGKKETVGRRADRSLSWRPHVCLFKTIRTEQNMKSDRVLMLLEGENGGKGTERERQMDPNMDIRPDDRSSLFGGRGSSLF